jgi:molybdopterin molybdotransferase
MLSVSEALSAIETTVAPLPAVTLPLTESLGLILAEDVFADRDSPPFDKALMDGYAVRAADLPEGRGRLAVIEEIVAGMVPVRIVGRGEATRIMTGAPIPEGADAVVAVEQTRTVTGNPGTVEIDSRAVLAGRNILKQGEATRRGDRVLPAGARLRFQELGCLAELGRAVVRVIRRPRIAVLATGDELVSVDAQPGPGQIRNSNETMLEAQIRQAGAVPVPLGIARDNVEELREKISRGLRYDALLLSGGVSAGKLDLVPSVLSELGVRQVFHKVRVKPGQPLWFGVTSGSRGSLGEHDESTESFVKSPDSPCYVFGLPGNPVSSMVCCELFARTGIRRLMGESPAAPVAWRAKLTCEFRHSGPRPTYHPARLEWGAEGPAVTPVPWVGSADLSATAGANALAVFEEGERDYTPGTTVDVIPL